MARLEQAGHQIARGDRAFPQGVFGKEVSTEGETAGEEEGFSEPEGDREEQEEVTAGKKSGDKRNGAGSDGKKNNAASGEKRNDPASGEKNNNDIASGEKSNDVVSGTEPEENRQRAKKKAENHEQRTANAESRPAAAPKKEEAGLDPQKAQELAEKLGAKVSEPQGEEAIPHAHPIETSTSTSL